MAKNKEGHIPVFDLVKNETDKLKKRHYSPPTKMSRKKDSPKPSSRRVRKMMYVRDREALPDYILNCQVVGYHGPCQVCEKGLRELRAQGIDPKIHDLKDVNEKMDAFIEVQRACNEKMARVNTNYK